MSLTRLFILINLFFALSVSSFAQRQIVYIDYVPRDTSYTLHQTYLKQKRYFPDIETVKDELPDNLLRLSNLTYKTIERENRGDRTLKLHIVRPNDQKKYPAILMIHGGGWSSGSPELQMPLAIHIASKGYVAIPVEYRLSPEAYFPAGIYDIKSAVKWIKANADEYQIDKDQIIVSGCSAGGQLACLCGTTNGNPNYDDPTDSIAETSSVQAIINIDGISDFTSQETIERARNTKGSAKLPADVLWLGGTYDEQTSIWEAASPVFHVTEKSAPICFINSSIPRFHYGRDELIGKLNTFDIYFEAHTIPDTPHTFWFFHPWFHQTVDFMLAFLAKIGMNE